MNTIRKIYGMYHAPSKKTCLGGRQVPVTSGLIHSYCVTGLVMQKYLDKLKNSSDLRNKMLMNFETGRWHEDSTFYTYLTVSEDDEDGNYNVYVDVKHGELLWNGWDPVYKVVSVLTKKFVDSRLTEEKSFLAILDEESGEYFGIPNKLARKEKLKC
jgi:hypothetical protein